MNSFNHYAYGAFASWVFEEASGIKPLEAGFRKVIIEPKPDKRLGTLCAEYNSKSGRIVSCWSFEDDRIRYDITVPVESLIIIDGKEYNVSAGSYIF